VLDGPLASPTRWHDSVSNGQPPTRPPGFV
jgi:hypothetical protein